MKKIIISNIIIATMLSSFLLQAKESDTGVRFSGLVSLEGRYNRGFDEVNTSDIAVDELGFAFEAKVNKWATGLISFLYEEGATDFEVDEAKITLGNTELSPLYLSLGQMYLPFGNYESHMVSDPLTLEIGEAREQAVLLGAEMGGVYATVYGFNGSTQDSAAEDLIDKYGFNVGFAQETDQYNFDVGVGFINDISDSDGLTDALGATSLLAYEEVNGLAAYLLLKVGPVSFIGEYITALDQFKSSHLAFNGVGAEPKAWNAELGYTFPIAGKETTFAVGYQGLEEIGLALDLPERRYLATASVGIFDNTTLSLEYTFDEDYDIADGGTGKDGHGAILQLAVEF
ncbi:LbtU family siderophore porin [Candidatus Marithrix sp. Canyon 246]|uniref:LbtU family siderophore porin n=2 Tax=Candidatus Marithrix sp. Canyon 246 TaxID=1827136 RepID=UPI00084A07FD|nr:LbtU family siderophore porin [Candidatus Marithrix sp. Canyon 246]